MIKLPSTYESYLFIEKGRLILLPDEGIKSARSIKRGVLFILAKWSGASQLAFRALNMALASFSDLDDLYLYVADTDSQETEELVAPLGDVLAGAGESYWFLEGEVKYKISAYKEDSLAILQDYTQRILPSRNQPPARDAERLPGKGVRSHS
jgi:hypothetical protein